MAITRSGSLSSCHVLAGGKIIRSGGRELALELEERGYGWVLEQAAAEQKAKGAAV